MNDLTELLARAGEVAHSPDLRVRLQWLEDTALAAEQSDLGELGARGALDLKAALGAILRYAQRPNDASVDQLEALVRTLIARGTSTIFAALADEWSKLVYEGPLRAQARALSDAFRALSLAAARGEPPPEDALARIREVADALPPLNPRA